MGKFFAMSANELKDLEAVLQALRECQAARADAERSSALKDEFLAVVAHELRSPLGAILGWAHMLRRRGSEEEFNRGLDVIEQSVQLQIKLIEDLLDLGRMNSGRLRLDFQPLEAAAFVEAAIEIIKPAADAKRIRIDRTAEPISANLIGDLSRLEQVMVNLLGNAVKFTPEGGCVRVALRRVDGWAEISVSDDGIGISPEFLPHVFDRFRQATDSARRQGGLGLGLAIARHLAQLHGGDIYAQSTGEGQGSTFVLRLPLAA